MSGRARAATLAAVLVAAAATPWAASPAGVAETAAPVAGAAAIAEVKPGVTGTAAVAAAPAASATGAPTAAPATAPSATSKSSTSSMASDADEVPACGPHASVDLSGPEYLGRLASLERGLFDGTLSHCGYALRRACLDWESGADDAGRGGFEMALRFCDDKTVGERGAVASGLARGDYAEAYAAWLRHSEAGAADSLALAGYARAVHAGYSATAFPPRGPAEYRLPAGRYDPDWAFRLSALPGAGFLYLGEPGLAARHFALGASLSALLGYCAWRGLAARDRDGAVVAWIDFGLVATFLWQRYYLGGMREAARLALEKNRAEKHARIAELAEGLDPFGSR